MRFPAPRFDSQGRHHHPGGGLEVLANDAGVVALTRAMAIDHAADGNAEAGSTAWMWARSSLSPPVRKLTDSTGSDAFA